MIESGQYQRSRGGRKRGLPAWARNKPKERPSHAFYIRAYTRLTSERRHFPNDVGPIPWSKVDLYGRRYGLGPFIHEWFVDVIMLLDQDYLAALENERDKDRKREEKRERRKARKAEGSAAGQSKRKARSRRW